MRARDSQRRRASSAEAFTGWFISQQANMKNWSLLGFGLKGLPLSLVTKDELSGVEESLRSCG